MPQPDASLGNGSTGSGPDFVLYVEGPGDRSILREWSYRLLPKLGRTLVEAKRLLAERRTAAIWTCTLLDKPSRREVESEADFIGFQIEDVFVVGYGIDYAEGYRHLPYIGVVE